MLTINRLKKVRLGAMEVTKTETGRGAGHAMASQHGLWPIETWGGGVVPPRGGPRITCMPPLAPSLEARRVGCARERLRVARCSTVQ